MLSHAKNRPASFAPGGFGFHTGFGFHPMEPTEGPQSAFQASALPGT